MSKSALHVLFIVPGSFSGSKSIFSRREAEALRRRGVGVEVYFFDNSSYAPGHFFRQAVLLKRKIREKDFDLLHAQFGKFNALLVVLAKWLAWSSKPLVITFRGTDINVNPKYSRLRAFLGEFTSQIAAFFSDGVIAVSKEIADKIWSKKNLIILPSGVDETVFRVMDRNDCRKSLGFLPDEKVVVFNSGHNATVKNLPLAQEAFALVRQKVPHARLLVLDGTVSPDLVPAVMNASDCLLVTSITEGSPVVVQEAMACGLPIVSVAVGDVRERIGGLKQCVITAADPRELAEGMQCVLTLEERSDGPSRIDDISQSNLAEKIETFYHMIKGKC